jgi:hypothetical protein
VAAAMTAMSRGDFKKLLAPSVRDYFVNHFLTSQSAWFVAPAPGNPQLKFFSRDRGLMWCCPDCGDVNTERGKRSCGCSCDLIEVTFE